VLGEAIVEACVPTTERARRVLELAAEYAVESLFVDAEHVLLALAAEGNGLAAHALRELGVDANAICACLQRLPNAPAGESRQPPRAVDQLLRLAGEELTPLQHTYVGTEHLLLALTRLSSGRCAAAMAALRLAPQRVRDEIYSILGHVA
jgi:ATP-dependent Clp protease ATP-binding subunit ClpC